MEEDKECQEPHSPFLGESRPEREGEILSARIYNDGPIVHFSLPGLAHITPRILVFRSPFDMRRVEITPDILEDPKDKKTREAKRNRKWKYMETTRKYK